MDVTHLARQMQDFLNLDGAEIVEYPQNYYLWARVLPVLNLLYLFVLIFVFYSMTFWHKFKHFVLLICIIFNILGCQIEM